MRLVWISHSDGLEGAEKCLLETAALLRERGCDIAVVVPSKGPLAEKLIEVGAQVTTIYHPWWIREFRCSDYAFGRFWRYALAVYRIGAFLYRTKPDLVVTNTIVSPSGALASKFLRIPHVWFIHEYLESDHGLHFELGRRFSLWCINRLSLKVITNSRAVGESFKDGIAGDKIQAVYQPVSVGSEPAISSGSGDNSDPFTIVLVGRKSRNKGQEDAIRAVAILSKKGINAQLSLVGNSEPGFETMLIDLADDLGIGNLVSFIPNVEDPTSYMTAATVVIVCSKNEAFGRVIVEGARLGKPMVVTSSGSTNEFVERGFSGLVYDYGDSQSLADAVERLYYNDAEREKLGNEAREWALRTFDENQYAAEMIKIFQGAVSRLS
jgi:glycosyltransferase involved in cell wall biosynthesis